MFMFPVIAHIFKVGPVAIQLGEYHNTTGLFYEAIILFLMSKLDYSLKTTVEMQLPYKGCCLIFHLF